MAAREFDIVLYGATGFTGLRTCQYLARNYKQGVRSSLPIIKADASSPESLEAMTARTKVVITTVGPFLKHGEPLVAACVKQGTHYIDSTGESPFVQ
ncbi:hypothetical protein BGZ58_006354, partial [Dissophora ornata]